MNLLNALKSRLATPLGKAIASVILATLILRFPWLITSWADQTLAKWVMDTADNVRGLALPIILLFVKQFNETGGTKPTTPEAETRVSQ